MTRDTSETVIVRAIDLLQVMRRRNMAGVSSRARNDIPAGGRVGVRAGAGRSPAVGHRACGYFARECLESARNRFAVLLQFLARYARDEREVGHVAVFVRNALVDPQGDHQGDHQGDPQGTPGWVRGGVGEGCGEALEVETLVEALAGQRGSSGWRCGSYSWWLRC